MVCRAVILAGILLGLTGCPYKVEVHRTYEFADGVNHQMPTNQALSIMVYYVDKDEIEQIAKDIYERDGLEWDPPYTFYGLFDYKTKTLYCQKWDFHLCGHELHHATDGSWHK